MPTVPPEQFPFCGPSYLAASPVIDAQRSFNLYPEPGYKSSKTGMGLIGRPGLSAAQYATVNSPVRQLWAGNGRFFAVGGTHFYELNSGGGITTDYGAIPGSANLKECKVIANAYGTQLIVFDRSAVGVFYASGGVMNHSLGTPSGTALTATALDYLDGFYVAIAAGASLSDPAKPNQINASTFGDGTSWPDLSFVWRTDAADLTWQLATLNGLLYIFGQKTTSIFYNAGNPGFPFARVNNGQLNLGCLSPATVAKFYNCLMWVGGDDTGYAQVYMMQGMNPVRVSNYAVENLLNTAALANFLNTWAYGYQEAGHTFYVLNLIPAGGNVPAAQLVYDLTTGLWHDRTYAAAWPICFCSLPAFFADVNLVGDSKSGKIYGQSINYPNDGTGNSITYTRTAPHLSGANKWLKHSRFELDGDFGTAQPTLDYSDDGGRNFGGRTLALQQAVDQGRGPVSPTFRRFFRTQMGRSRDRVYKTTITDNANLIRIANAYLDVAG